MLISDMELLTLAHARLCDENKRLSARLSHCKPGCKSEGKIQMEIARNLAKIYELDRRISQA